PGHDVAEGLALVDVAEGGGLEELPVLGVVEDDGLAELVDLVHAAEALQAVEAEGEVGGDFLRVGFFIDGDGADCLVGVVEVAVFGGLVGGLALLVRGGLLVSCPEVDADGQAGHDTQQARVAHVTHARAPDGELGRARTFPSLYENTTRRTARRIALLAGGGGHNAPRSNMRSGTTRPPPP